MIRDQITARAKQEWMNESAVCCDRMWPRRFPVMFNLLNSKLIGSWIIRAKFRATNTLYWINKLYVSYSIDTIANTKSYDYLNIIIISTNDIIIGRRKSRTPEGFGYRLWHQDYMPGYRLPQSKSGFMPIHGNVCRQWIHYAKVCAVKIGGNSRRQSSHGILLARSHWRVQCKLWWVDVSLLQREFFFALMYWMSVGCRCCVQEQHEPSPKAEEGFLMHGSMHACMNEWNTTEQYNIAIVWKTDRALFGIVHISAIAFAKNSEGHQHLHPHQRMHIQERRLPRYLLLFPKVIGESGDLSHMHVKTHQKYKLPSILYINQSSLYIHSDSILSTSSRIENLAEAKK